MPVKLCLVVPCYNEEDCIIRTNAKLLDKLNKLTENGMITDDSKIVYVNDGSTDNTLKIIKGLADTDKRVALINLTRNRGHQNALLCGLMYVKDKCDVTVSLDADLQDDIDAIDSMLKEHRNGANIVYGVREDRSSDTFTKKVTAEGFYKYMTSLGVETVFNHADFRLMDSKALNELSQYDEVNLFLRGVIPQLGLKTSKVFYIRREREQGSSKYTLKKMCGLAVNGITSFSEKPLYIPIWMSIICLLAFLTLGILSIVFSNIYLLLLSALFFCTGLILLGIGIVAVYTGKVMLEVKHRPKYSIESTIGLDE